MPPDLKSPELTAPWELRLKSIAQGKESQNKFMAEIENYTKSLIRQIKNAGGTFRHDNLTRHKCPQCGKLMLEVTENTGRCSCVRTENAAIARQSPDAPTPAALSAIKKWNCRKRRRSEIRLLLRSQGKAILFSGEKEKEGKSAINGMWLLI